MRTTQVLWFAAALRCREDVSERGFHMCVAIRFNSTDGSMYFARNFDWSQSYNEKMVGLPRGCKVQYAHEGESEVKYDTFGLGIAYNGTVMYFDAMNEKSLAVAVLSLPETTKFSDVEDGKVNVACFEFPTWALANYADTYELEEALKNVAITAGGFDALEGVGGMHWIFADQKRSIVVESTVRGLEVFDDDLDIVTNEPGFAWHRQNVRNYLGVSSEVPATENWGRSSDLKPVGHGPGMRGIPGDYSPVSRFVKSAFINANYPVQESEEDNVTRMFRTVGTVAVPLGAMKMEDGTWDYTLFQAGYSAKTMTCFYSTYDDPTIRTYRLADIDFGDRTAPVVCEWDD